LLKLFKIRYPKNVVAMLLFQRKPKWIQYSNFKNKIHLSQSQVKLVVFVTALVLQPSAHSSF